MLKRLEAIVDNQGKIQLLEPVKLPAGRRVTIMILSDKLESNASQQTSEAGNIEVHFLHPREPKIFTAIIHPECTGEEALEGLMKGDKNGAFLDIPPAGRPYDLIASSRQQVIEPQMTFAQAGVVQGDTIEVRQAGQGAGFNYTEIAELVISSGLSLAFLKAAASVITQLIKSREKTFEVDKNGEKYKLTASSSVEEMIEVIRALRGENTSELQTFLQQTSINPPNRLKASSASKERAAPSHKQRTLPAAQSSSSKKSSSRRSNAKSSSSKKRQA